MSRKCLLSHGLILFWDYWHILTFILDKIFNRNLLWSLYLFSIIGGLWKFWPSQQQYVVASSLITSIDTWIILLVIKSHCYKPRPSYSIDHVRWAQSSPGVHLSPFTQSSWRQFSESYRIIPIRTKRKPLNCCVVFRRSNHKIPLKNKSLKSLQAMMYQVSQKKICL